MSMHCRVQVLKTKCACETRASAKTRKKQALSLIKGKRVCHGSRNCHSQSPWGERNKAQSITNFHKQSNAHRQTTRPTNLGFRNKRDSTRYSFLRSKHPAKDGLKRLSSSTQKTRKPVFSSIRGQLRMRCPFKGSPILGNGFLILRKPEKRR